MKVLNDYDLLYLKGGSSSVSGTLLNSISRLITSLLDLGRTIGSAIRYGRSKMIC